MKKILVLSYFITLIGLHGAILNNAIGDTAKSHEDLVDIYQLALQSDPTYKAAEAQQLSTQQLLPQARSYLLPILNLSANQQWMYVNSDKSDLNETLEEHGVNLTLGQTLFDWSALSGTRVAGFQVDQANANYAAAAQDLILRTATAYFNVLLAYDNLQVTRAEKAASSRRLDQTQQRFDVGLLPISDLQGAKANYDFLVAQEIGAENALADNYEQLREITGRVHTAIAVLKQELPLIKPEPTDPEQWARWAEQHNLSLKAANFGVQAAREQIRFYNAKHLPTLDFQGSAGATEGDEAFGDQVLTDTAQTATANFVLNLPVFQGGLIVSQARQARYDFEAASSELEASYRLVTSTTRQSYRGVVAGISQIEAFQQAVISNQVALDAMEAGYEVGTKTIVDVLDLQEDLYGSERDLLQAKYQYILDTLRLKLSAGSLSLTDIEVINGWLVSPPSETH